MTETNINIQNTTLSENGFNFEMKNKIGNFTTEKKTLEIKSILKKTNSVIKKVTVIKNDKISKRSLKKRKRIKKRKKC